MSRLALSLLCAFFLLGASETDERVITGDGVVAGSLNGVPFRLRVEPGALAIPIVTADIARQAGLKAGPFDWEYVIGEKKVEGESAVARIDFGKGPEKRRVAWTQRRAAETVDGVVGPGMLREDVIRFVLRPEIEGEREAVFRMVGQGGMEEKWGERFARIEVGGAPLRVQFDPLRARSVATANAGARLAAAFDGIIGQADGMMIIGFGIERPIRTLTLGTALQIGSLSLDEVAVRTNDFGSIDRIRTERRNSDPNEIVVRATTTRAKNHDQLILGADYLDACSQIIFDKRRKQIRLRCI